MPNKKLLSFSYYFLNKRLHPSAPSGFRASVILFIINHNSGRNTDKFLFVREVSNGYLSWGLPKEGLESDIVVDDILIAITRNLEEELGFRGMKVSESKPAFFQKALFFDFAVQKYDQSRAMYEASRKRPSKGKVYHLAIMEYHGPEEMPITPDKDKPEIDAAKWVDLNQGLTLIREYAKTFNQTSSEFNEELLKKIVNVYTNLKLQTSGQQKLF